MLRAGLEAGEHRHAAADDVHGGAGGGVPHGARLGLATRVPRGLGLEEMGGALANAPGVSIQRPPRRRDPHHGGEGRAERPQLRGERSRWMRGRDPRTRCCERGFRFRLAVVTNQLQALWLSADILIYVSLDIDIRIPSRLYAPSDLSFLSFVTLPPLILGVQGVKLIQGTLRNSVLIHRMLQLLHSYHTVIAIHKHVSIVLVLLSCIEYISSFFCDELLYACM